MKLHTLKRISNVVTIRPYYLEVNVIAIDENVNDKISVLVNCVQNFFPLKIHRSTRGGRVERSSLRRSNRAGSGRASNRDPTEVQRLKRIRRAKANDRERNRMHMLNVALEKLRVVLPAFPGKLEIRQFTI